MRRGRSAGTLGWATNFSPHWKNIRRTSRRTAIAIACAATFATATMADAEDVIIHKTDPELTNSIVIKEKQDPDLVIRKKKVVIKEDIDADVTIEGSINVD